jgi:chromosome segregation ATPase
MSVSKRKGPRDASPLAQSIYDERRKTFLASLDSILRDVGSLNRREITKAIDELISTHVSSEREAFLTTLTELISNESRAPLATFEDLCSRLVDIAGRQHPKDRLSALKGQSLRYLRNPALTDIFLHQLQTTSQFRSDIGGLKAAVVSTVSGCISSLAQSKQTLKSATIRAISAVNVRVEQLQDQLVAQKQVAKEREERIAAMQATMQEMNEQLAFFKTQRTSNARIVQLERQLAEKNRTIEEAKEESDKIIAGLEQELDEKVQYLEKQRRTYNAKISELEQRLDDQASTIAKSATARDSMVGDLESQIADRDKVIEQQRKNSSSQISQLESLLEDERRKTSRANSLVKSKEEEIDDLQISLANAQRDIARQTDELTVTQGSMTLAEIDDLKGDLDERNEEIKELKAKVEQMNGYSQSLDEMRSTYLRQSQEVDGLKRDLEGVKRKSVDIETENAQLSQTVQELELQLGHSEYEKSTMRSEVDHALMIVKLRKAKIKRLKTENSELRSNLSETRKGLETSQAQLMDLHSVSGDTELESSYLKQQLSLTQADSERNSALLAAMKVKLETAASDLQEKATSIQELIKANERKTLEIEALQSKLSGLQQSGETVKSQLKLINKTRRIEEQEKVIAEQQERLNALEGALAQAKANYRKVVLTAKGQQRKIDQLTAKLGQTRTALKDEQGEVERLLNATTELATGRSQIAAKSEESEFSNKMEIDRLQGELQDERRSKARVSNHLARAKSATETLMQEREELRTQLLQLLSTHEDLQRETQMGASSISHANERLLAENKKLTEIKRALTEDFRKVDLELRDLKRTSSLTIAILEKRVAKLSDDLNRTRSDCSENVASLEQQRDQLNSSLGETTIAYRQYSSVFHQLSSMLQTASAELLLQKTAELIETKDQLEDELDNTREQLARALDDGEQKAAATEQLSQENAELAGEIDRLAVRIRKLRSVSSARKRELAQLKERYAAELG